MGLSRAHADAAYTLTATLTGTTVTVAWTAPADHSTTDWVALYPLGIPDTNYTASGVPYQYLPTTANGVLTFAAPSTSGTYEARAFHNNGYEKVATSAAFTIGGGSTGDTTYTLTATLTGTTVTVAWTAPADHSTTDWVALYTPGAVDTDYNASGASYRYLSAAASGTLTFTAPTTPGTYEARLFNNNTYTKIATSAAFTIGGGAPPTVQLTAPTPTQTFTAPATLELTATASAAAGHTLTKVEFFQGATLLGTATSSPYKITWPNVPAGTYILTAKATDEQNLTTTSSPVTITVGTTPPSGDITPSYVLTATPKTVPSRGTVTVRWTKAVDAFASRGDQIGLYQVGAPIQTPLSAQPVGATTEGTLNFTMPDVPGAYEFRYFYVDYIVSLDPPIVPGRPPVDRPTPRRPRTIYVVLVTSKPVTVTSSTNQPPSVRLLSPAAGATFTAPATITLTATASDPDGTITKVEFLQGNTILTDDTVPPYEYTWRNVPIGTYQLTAQAIDNAGAQVQSAPAVITVTAASTTSAEEILRTVAKNSELIQDMTAEMTISTVLDLQPLGEPQYYRYWFKKPDREKTATYASAERKTKTEVTILQGPKMYLVDPATKAVQEVNLLGDMTDGAGQFDQMNFFYDVPRFLENHTVKRDESNSDAATSIVVIDAIPKHDNPIYSKLKLFIDERKGFLMKSWLYKREEMIQRVEVKESVQMPNGAWVPVKMTKAPLLTSGNLESTLTYSNLQLNVGLTDADFDPSRQ